MRILLLLFLGTLISCTECPEKTPPFTQLTLFGRDEIQEDGSVLRRPIYRVNVPTSWSYTYKEGQNSLNDTTEPLLRCDVGEIVLTLHTFPSHSLQKRVPPLAQVRRWGEQIDCIDPSRQKITSLSRGGFYGLLLEAAGDKGLIAWCMQMDPILYQKVRFLANSHQEIEYAKQISSDYTIKVIGPPTLLEKHREEFFAFAKSFELISPLPNP